MSTKSCAMVCKRLPSPPAPLPQAGEGSKPAALDCTAAPDACRLCTPSPACGRGPG
ncbi:hypothetical protein CBM2587_A90081 [Cupriavidus taiwanensis]|uniref:Uncharacterized protein n=1 Tax=Cupriavidus taiwanensis TaxID=164546 RepID=A0A975X411_9BURK|nr:hypothetical protein CBM2587_A90081 [Cupriavidus taiwanensis]